jgi:hypothetical protein
MSHGTCPKHVESDKTGNKKYCGVTSCRYLLMNHPTMHGIQNIKKKKPYLNLREYTGIIVASVDDLFY